MSRNAISKTAALNEARRYHSLSPMGDQWTLITTIREGKFEGWTTGGQITAPYAQARGWYRDAVAQEALEIMGAAPIEAHGAVNRAANYCATLVDLLDHAIEICDFDDDGSVVLDFDYPDPIEDTCIDG